MIDITKLPIVDFRNDTEKQRDEDEMRDEMIRDGRTARRLGYPNEPPPYRVEDWSINWSMGWRWEDEDIKRREHGKRKTD